jgi:DNA-binding NarL/FixJ family response regulator
MKQSEKTRKSNSDRKLNEILRQLDVLVIIQLAKSGLTLKEIAKVLNMSEDTIERMLPFRKLKSKRHEE